MRTPQLNLLFPLALLATSGCTLLVGAELSGDPLEADDDGGAGGHGGSGASTTSVHASSASSSSSSSSGVVCPPNMANCGGIGMPGCNVNLMNDPENCGSCHHVCVGLTMHCTGGTCK